MASEFLREWRSRYSSAAACGASRMGGGAAPARGRGEDGENLERPVVALLVETAPRAALHVAEARQLRHRLEQRPRLHRLAEVALEAGPDRLLAVVAEGEGGDGGGRDPPAGRGKPAQLADQRQPVLVGQADVAQDHVRR